MNRLTSHTVLAALQTALLLCAGVLTNAAAQSGVEIHLRGTIGTSHEVEMALTIDGGDVSGDYRYVTIGRSLTLTGTVDSQGRVNLEEDDAAGHPTGRFRGWLVGRSRFFGTWSRLNGTHSVPFDLTSRRRTPATTDATADASAGVEGRATLTKRTLVINRTPTVVKDSPGKARATLHFPVVSGVRDPEALARLKKALGIASVLRESVDQSTADVTEDTWLDTVNYTVNCDRENVLDITFSVSGSGAYPDTQTVHRRLSLLTGLPIKPRDAFIPTEIAALEARVNRLLRAEVAEAEHAKDAGDASDALASAHFGREDLERFVVGVRGVTFVYDYGLPHAQRALQPPGRFFLTYSALRRYIRPDGPLAPLAAVAPAAAPDDEQSAAPLDQ